MPDNRKYADRAEYLKKAVTKRRQTIRKRLVEYKGGACEICGYDRCVNALDFHHKDASQKEFAISAQGLTRAWTKVQAESDRCVLLCANCHREIHANYVQPDWVTNQ